jgi:hypothetical protein
MPYEHEFLSIEQAVVLVVPTHEVLLSMIEHVGPDVLAYSRVLGRCLSPDALAA